MRNSKIKTCFYFKVNFLVVSLIIVNCYQKIYAQNLDTEVKIYNNLDNEKGKKNYMNYQEELNKYKFQIPEPSPLKDVIILDAGHGYMDSGGGRDGYYEYVPNAQLIFKLANELVNTGFFEVYITHPLNYAENNLIFNSKVNPNHKFIHVILPEIEPNKQASSKIGTQNYSKKYGAGVLRLLIQKIVAELKKYRSKIFSLSIHHNVYISIKTGKVDDSATGMEVFYTEKGKNIQYSDASIKFCNTLLDFCKKLYGKSTTHKVKATKSEFAVTDVNCPAALCEIDYISNLERQKIISSNVHQNRMVRGIKNAILQTYGYTVMWANVKFEKGTDKNEVRITISNLPQTMDNLKIAAFGVSKQRDQVSWLNATKVGDKWICTTRLEDEKNFSIDLYSKINGKETFIDSDFNTLEML